MFAIETQIILVSGLATFAACYSAFPVVFCSASYFQAKNFVHEYQLDMANLGANVGPSDTGSFEESA